MPTPPSQDAQALHAEHPAIDLHADTLMWSRWVGYDLHTRHEPPLPKAAFGGHVDLPRMRDGGSIVLMSSDTIYWGAPRLLHYVTSKSALVGMTRSLARELAPRMIRVNCMLPGLTMGEATKDIPQARWNDYAERTMLKRVQQPDDLEGPVAFLLSEDAKFITGQTLAVDGGFSLH